MSKKALLPITNGFEEIEAITVIDILRRAGVEVTVAALEKRQIIGAHGVEIKTDTVLSDIKPLDFDLLVLAGGAANAKSLCENETAQQVIREFDAVKKLIGAICAAPTALAAAGVIRGKYTCFGGYEKEIGGQFVEAKVVESGNVITSQGAGTAGEFAFKLVEKLVGADAAQTLRARMYY